MLRHGCFFGVGILLCVMAKGGFSIRHNAMLLLGIALCWVEIVARVAELRADYAHVVSAGMLTISALTTFSTAVLGMWLFSRLNNALRPGTAAQSVMRYLGLVTYPLYLMHEGVGGVTASLFQAAGYTQGLALWAGLALSLIAASLVVIAPEPWLKPRLTAMALRIVARLGSVTQIGKSA
jgi:peptidoglycan/LPS O-acetylase OafA/YrhL